MLTKTNKGIFQLIFINGAWAISVVTPKGVLPVCHVFPERLELLEVDGAAVISVKHANHQTNRLWVEWLPGTCK